MKRYLYLCCCTDLVQPKDIEGLSEMVRTSTQVTYETVRRRCLGLRGWARLHHYEVDRRRGLTLQQDHHVSFHKSKILGNPCYYVRWSAIEFIWVRWPGKVPTNA